MVMKNEMTNFIGSATWVSAVHLLEPNQTKYFNILRRLSNRKWLFYSLWVWYKHRSASVLEITGVVKGIDSSSDPEGNYEICFRRIEGLHLNLHGWLAQNEL